MVEDTPSTRQDPEEAWLLALAGRHPAGTPPAPSSDEAFAARTGQLIRARFEKALRQVRAAPDPELTRMRILTAAAAGLPAPPRSRALAIASAASAGLAAGIVGTVLLQPAHAHRDFADVRSSQENISNTEMRAATALTMRRFTLISRNVSETAAELAAILARAGVPFRVSLQPERAVEFDVPPLANVPASLTQAASALNIDFPPDTAIRVYILDHASK
jgi:hypothetical protein